jgi:hypothetical protein
MNLKVNIVWPWVKDDSMTTCVGNNNVTVKEGIYSTFLKAYDAVSA